MKLRKRHSNWRRGESIKRQGRNFSRCACCSSSQSTSSLSVRAHGMILKC